MDKRSEERKKNDLGELSLCGDARSSEKPRTNEGNWFVLGHFHSVLLSRLHALIIMQLELNGKLWACVCSVCGSVSRTTRHEYQLPLWSLAWQLTCTGGLPTTCRPVTSLCQHYIELYLHEHEHINRNRNRNRNGNRNRRKQKQIEFRMFSSQETDTDFSLPWARVQRRI